MAIKDNIGTRRSRYIFDVRNLQMRLSFFIHHSFRWGGTVHAAISTAAVMLAVGVVAGLVGTNPLVAGELTPYTVNELGGRADGLLEHKQTEYNDIFVTEQNSLVTMSFQRLGQRYTESIIDLDDLSVLPVTYTRNLTVGLAYVPHMHRLLMLGLGGGTTTRYFHGYLPDVHIDAVEIGPGVVEIAKRYFQIREGETYRIFEDDAREYLVKNAIRYDIIMMDTFRGGYIPSHLLTQQFFELVKARVTDGGSLVINLQRGNELFASIVKTLKTVFQSVDFYSSRLGGNTIVVSYDDARRAEADLLSTARDLQTRHGFRYSLTALLSLRLRVDIDPDAVVLTDDFTPANLLNEVKP